MTTPRVSDAPPAVRRQLPRWSQLRPLLGFQAPSLGTGAKLARAATIEDLRELARRSTPRSVFDYTDGAADDESSEAGWFPIESMPEMTPQHRARVLSALAPDAPWHGREEGLARAGRV